MRIQLLTFATARDYFGFAEKEVSFNDGESSKVLFAKCKAGFKPEELGWRVALDGEYIEWNEMLDKKANGKDLAVIPPVSGG
ncbi:MAG: MoaD/ThiS family protein [Verrucomicrobiota bacterium]